MPVTTIERESATAPAGITDVINVDYYPGDLNGSIVVAGFEGWYPYVYSTQESAMWTAFEALDTAASPLVMEWISAENYALQTFTGQDGALVGLNTWTDGWNEAVLVAEYAIKTQASTFGKDSTGAWLNNISTDPTSSFRPQSNIGLPASGQDFTLVICTNPYYTGTNPLATNSLTGGSATYGAYGLDIVVPSNGHVRVYLSLGNYVDFATTLYTGTVIGHILTLHKDATNGFTLRDNGVAAAKTYGGTANLAAEQAAITGSLALCWNGTPNSSGATFNHSKWRFSAVIHRNLTGGTLPETTALNALTSYGIFRTT